MNTESFDKKPNFTPPYINSLLPNKIFVFGSNLAGAHVAEQLELLMKNLTQYMDKA